MPRDRRPYILLPLAALIAVLPLMLHGPSCGHDYDFHVINWFEALNQFAHGNLQPHWAFTPAWNAGEPRFVFYPPLSWTIGALLGLIMPHAFGGWTWTPNVYIWLALTAAGLSLFHTARSFAPSNAALIAAAVYIANPYTLYTAYERSAYAELLAAAWLPLLLGAILRERVTIPGIAIPIALLWLTNAPAAVMGCYALALLTLIRLVSTPDSANRARLALTTIAGTVLGLGLGAFYILPAAYERRYVQIALAILPGMSPQDNFLFQHLGDNDHDGVLLTASIVAVLLVALTAIALLLARSAARTSNKPGARSATTHLLLQLTILTAVIAFMQTPLSTFLWTHLPQLRFLQFPWRLCAILATTFALALAIALSRISIKSTLVIASSLIAVILQTFPAYHAFRQRCYPEDTVEARLAVFRSANPGTDPTEEYTPTATDNESLSTENPGYWLASTADEPAPNGSAPAPAPTHLDVAPATPSILIFNLRDYPAWQITRTGPNGMHLEHPTHLQRPDGLIAIPIPAGSSHIELRYATLPDQQLGYLITALSIVILTIVFLRARSTQSAHHSQLSSHR